MKAIILVVGAFLLYCDGFAEEGGQARSAFFSPSQPGFHLRPLVRESELVIILRYSDERQQQAPSVTIGEAQLPSAEPNGEVARFDPLLFASPEQAKAFNEYYREFFDHPLQIWVPSEHGPVPLFNDVVFDSNGRPKPRMPDPYTYLAMTHPTETNIAQYQLQRQGALRQFRVSQSKLIPVAEELGIVTPEHLMVQAASDPDAIALGSWEAIDPDSRGQPMLTDEQRRADGLARDQIPRTPGLPNDIEVFWFWHHSCEWSMNNARDWANFASMVNQRGYKAVGIALSPEISRASAQLELWQIRGLPMQHVKNFQDNTGMRQALRIESTPTLVFLHRPTGRILRHDEAVSEATMRETLNRLAGWPAGTWPPPHASADQREELVPVPAPTNQPRRSSLGALLEELP